MRGGGPSGSLHPARPGRAAAILVCAAAALGGCGEDAGAPSPAASQAEPQIATPRDRRLIEAYDRRIAAHCLRVSRSVVEPSAAPTPRQRAGALRAARRLVALAAEKPGAQLGAGQDLRLFVSDVIENLEGSNCDPRMIEVLASGLARIQQP